MTMNEILIQALSPVGLPVYPDTYTGQDAEYLVFNFDATPILFGDGKPVYLQYLIQVHLFAPHRMDEIAHRESVVNSLFVADFTYPAEENASDEEGQHFVYECKYLEYLGGL